MKSAKICNGCNVLKPLNEFYKHKRAKDNRYSLCKECARERSRKFKREHKNEIRQKRGCKSMYENKLCASYLGIVVAEQLCHRLFKNVEIMPYGNSGFDFICNRNKKIDVKSGCIQLSNGKYPRWEFRIEKNKIADYFICVAFDNRTDLNLLHMWMIPGSEVNNRPSIEMRLSTFHKWDEWKRDIKDAQICCSELKNN